MHLTLSPRTVWFRIPEDTVPLARRLLAIASRPRLSQRDQRRHDLMLAELEQRAAHAQTA